MKKIIITIEQVGERLDKFLGDTLSETTRSQVQKLIKQELVTVNKKKVTPHYKVKENDVVEIKEETPKITNPKTITREEDLPKVKIIEETPEYLIINKPAGLIVHGTKFVKGKTLVDVLIPKFPELAKIGEDPDRPAIVHRLDREVNGLMVIPRTQDSFDNLKKQFQKRTIEKRYTALVYGAINKISDEINFPIRRSSEGYKMAAVPETKKGKPNKEGKRAITEFKVLQNFINYTLLEVKIKTGRTHQIRVHMTAYGHPIVGDDLYSTKKTREKNAKIKLNRVFLVATTLEFTNLQEERKKYKLELPKNLQDFLKTAK